MEKKIKKGIIIHFLRKLIHLKEMLEVIKYIEQSECFHYIRLGHTHVCICWACDKKINVVEVLLMLESSTVLLENNIIFFNK